MSGRKSCERRTSYCHRTSHRREPWPTARRSGASSSWGWWDAAPWARSTRPTTRTSTARSRSSWSAPTTEPDGQAGRSRLMREAQATARISHPNVVVVYEADTLGRPGVHRDGVRRRPHPALLARRPSAGPGWRSSTCSSPPVAGWRRRTTRTWSTATSNPTTSWCRATARCASWTSAWPAGARRARLERDGAAGDRRRRCCGSSGHGGHRPDCDPEPRRLRAHDVARDPGRPGREADPHGDADGNARLHVPRAVSRPIRGRALGPVQLLRRAVRGAVQRAAVRGADADRARGLRRRGPPHRTAGVRHGPRVAAGRAQARAVRESGGPLPVDERSPRRDRSAAGQRRGPASRAARPRAWRGSGRCRPSDAGRAPAPEKDEVRRAFLATGKAYAEATFDRTRSLLDRYVERWSDLYVEACEATHVRGEQSTEVLDLRIECLMEGLRDLTALCRLFRAATRGGGRERRRARRWRCRRPNAAGTSSFCARSCGHRPTRPRRRP